MMNSRYDRVAQRHFITSDDIRAASLRGESALAVRDNITVTDEAREIATKLGIQLAMPSRLGPATVAPARSVASVAGANGGAPVQVPPKDTVRRVADAIAAVLDELKLGDRAAALAPVLTRRVLAGFSTAAERK